MSCEYSIRNSRPYEVPDGWIAVKIAWLLREKYFNIENGPRMDISDYHYPSPEEVVEYQKWCVDNVGLFYKEWCYVKVDFAFYFRDGEDAITFKMRFGLR